MIVIDTTVLVYAVGAEHPFRAPCRNLVRAIAEGTMQATTTVEVIQEFVHVRARRRSRAEAAGLGADFAVLLAPLMAPTVDDLTVGLDLFRAHRSLGAFDAVLAATAMAAGADALVSADRAFARIAELNHLLPAEAVEGGEGEEAPR